MCVHVCVGCGYGMDMVRVRCGLVWVGVGVRAWMRVCV